MIESWSSTSLSTASTPLTAQVISAPVINPVEPGKNLSPVQAPREGGESADDRTAASVVVPLTASVPAT